MGLFDKRKKGDDFDSPVENIDLSAPPVEPEPEPRVMASPAQETPAAQTRQIEAEPPPDDDDFDDVPPYGIDDAIQLMRALPGDNVELVVQVVKRTLESTKVKVKTIIDDASRKQSDIEGRIDVLKKEIAEYEQEIATRKEEISKLEADHKETTMVKDRLELAEKLSDKPKAAARPAPSATTPPSAGGAAATPPSAGGATPARTKPATVPPPSGTASSTGSGAGGSAQPKPSAKGTTIVAKK